MAKMKKNPNAGKERVNLQYMSIKELWDIVTEMASEGYYNGKASDEYAKVAAAAKVGRDKAYKDTIESKFLTDEKIDELADMARYKKIYK